MIDHALAYLRQGYSVIPCGKNKKSLVKWKPYQTRLPTIEEVEAWWVENPNAQIAVITGSISDLSVVDTDSENATEEVTKLVGQPTVKTPSGGCHWWFKSADHIGNKTGFIPKADFRSKGGYVVVPPSKGLNGNDYHWVTQELLSDRTTIPSVLVNLLIPIGTRRDKIGTHRDTKPLIGTDRDIRDNGDNRDIRDSEELPQWVEESAGFLDSYMEETSSGVGEPSEKGETTSTHIYNNISLPPARAREADSKKHKAPTFNQGTRDDDMFRHALGLFRGGWDISNVTDYCLKSRVIYDPPLTPQEVEEKVRSALRHFRERNAGAATSQQVKDWIDQQHGVFNTFECYRDNDWESTEQKAYVRKILGRLADKGELNRTRRAGQFAPIASPIDDIDIFAPTEDAMNVRYPLDLHTLYDTLERTITCVVSSPNVGKTAFALNFALMNIPTDYKIRYLSSEFGAQELVVRLKKFKIPLDTWKNVSFKEVPAGWEDYIIPDGINIVDYLEPVDGDYSKIGVNIDLIHERLTTGMCLICLQKKWGQDLGQGGVMTLKKPRLYVTIESDAPDGNIAKIIKLKNRAKGINYAPDGRICRFKIVDGARIDPNEDAGGAVRWEPPPQKGGR